MSNLNTTNSICRMMVEVIATHGVEQIMVSPGSRNTPLIIAASRSERVQCHYVVDERSAAFIALGIASITNRPVAIICTSGTALLNYAPAVAEAYYRHLPLIVISADRPQEWIDQDDSQTLRQFEALHNFVKRSYNIPVGDNETNLWYANRMVNDAMLQATEMEFPAPVHINVQLGEPLGEIEETGRESFRSISVVNPRADLTVSAARELGRSIASPQKVMIIAGFHAPDKRLNSALAKLSRMPNIVVFTESISNLHSPEFINRIDSTLSALSDKELADMAPDCVITLGGALVSRHIKQYLRKYRPSSHWHVAKTATTVDCFKCLTTRINMDAGIFFQQLASAMQPHTAACDYARQWRIINQKAIATHQAYLSHAPWSDLKAMEMISNMTPKGWNVQYSNGTAVRYGQLFADGKQHRCDCNRGVSGIDGCTSTAVGAAIAYRPQCTLLITGDMSAQYDIGAFAFSPMPPRLKIIVLNNGGGGIFRFIASTKHLPERESTICLPPASSPWKDVCSAYGFNYYRAENEQQLREQFKMLEAGQPAAALLEVVTPPEVSAEVLTNYFDRNKIFKNHDTMDSNQTV